MRRERADGAVKKGRGGITIEYAIHPTRKDGRVGGREGEECGRHAFGFLTVGGRRAGTDNADGNATTRFKNY